MVLSELTAENLMQRTLVTARASEKLRDAVQRMHCEKIQCLLIPPESKGKAVGILTSKDVVKLLGHEPLSVLEELLVADVMTRPAICVQKDTCVADCVELMRMAGIRRVPVLHGSTLVGILSCSDVFRTVAAALGTCPVASTGA